MKVVAYNTTQNSRKSIAEMCGNSTEMWCGTSIVVWWRRENGSVMEERKGSESVNEFW